MAAQPLVDLCALREMYSAAVTLSIDYSQEVCGAEEKVGGVESRVRISRPSWRKICQSLDIIREQVSGGALPQSLPAPPGTTDAGAR